MKRKSVLILSALLLIAVGNSLWAFDFGGSFSSASSVSGMAGQGFVNEESLGLWLETGRGKHYSFEMKNDLIASVSQDPISGEFSFEFYLNPDYLKLDGFWEDLEYGPSILATSFGRFTTSDFTTKVFSQKLDGMIMNFNYPSLELTIAAGTTALMFANTGSQLTTTPATITSKTDAASSSNTVSLFEYLADPATDASLFDNPKAVEIITLTLPQLFAKQSLTFSMVAQEDLRPMIDVIKGYSDTDYVSPLLAEGEETFYADRGGAVDTQYLGAGISGPSIPSLYHNVYYYFGTGRSLSYVTNAQSDTGSSYEYKTIVSHMVGANVDYFMPWLFNSRASLAMTFGTGDADATTFYEGNTADYYTQFTPIATGGGGILFSPGISNILSAKAGFSLKPLGWIPLKFLKTLQVSGAMMPFFRVNEGPVSVSGISPDFTGNYLGSEIDLTVNMRPFSDLGVIVQAGYFLPNGTAFAGSEMANPSFTAKLNVSLSF